MNCSKKATFLCTLFLFFFIARPADAAVLTLDPLSTSVAPGGEFTVKVGINTQGEYVTSTDIVLNFDSSLLQVVSVVNGDSGKSPFFPDLFQNIAQNQLYIGASIISPTDKRFGQGTVATIRLKALVPGNATLSFLCTPDEQTIPILAGRILVQQIS